MAWILLSDTRRKCLWIWMSMTVVVSLWTLIQTLTGLLSDMAVSVGWLWVFLNLFPGLIALFVSLLQNRYPAKIIPHAVHKGLYLGAMAYLALVMLTLIAEPLATQGAWSLITYLEKSYLWLAPFHLLLLAGFSLTFYRKELIFLPNEKILQDLASQNAEKWKKKGNLLRSRCLEAIASGDLAAAFELVKEHLPIDDSRQVDVVMLQGEYTLLRQNIDLNLVAPDEAQRQLNRITMALLNIIEQL